MKLAQIESTSKVDLLDDLRELVNHPEFFDVGKYVQESYCWDTTSHHYQLDIINNKPKLLKYQYTTTANGDIELDNNSEQEIAIASLAQFLKSIDQGARA